MTGVGGFVEQDPDGNTSLTPRNRSIYLRPASHPCKSKQVQAMLESPLMRAGGTNGVRASLKFPFWILDSRGNVSHKQKTDDAIISE